MLLADLPYCLSCLSMTVKLDSSPQNHLCFFFKKLINFWLCWVIIAVHGLSLVIESRGYSIVAEHRFLTIVTSLVAEHRL